jgi:hypothetical protein
MVKRIYSVKVLPQAVRFLVGAQRSKLAAYGQCAGLERSR